MSEWKVHSALINSFVSLGKGPVSYEQREFKPPADETTLYYELFNLPASRAPRTLGSSGTDEYRGVFQIDVVGPGGEGVRSVIEEASEISAFYVAGLRFSKDGQEVTVRRSQISPASPKGVKVTVSVSVSWVAYIPRQ